MLNSQFTPIRGFKSFTSLWYEACEQISQEYNITTLDNDIKLFCLLRKMVLTSENPVFVRSYKLKDLNLPMNKTGTFLIAPDKRAYTSWNHIPKPRCMDQYPPYKKHIAPNTPAPISYLRIGNAKIIEYKNQIQILNNCVFEPTELYKPNDNLYTVSDDNFATTLDNACAFYPVSSKIVAMFATKQQNCFNLKTFKELTEKMYQKLLNQRESLAK